MVDHANDPLLRFPGDPDVMHRSAEAWLAPNDERSGHPGRWELVAHIVAPGLPEDDQDVPLMVLETQDGPGGPYVELDAEQVEEFIRQGKAFLAHVQQLGEQLAASSRKGKRS
ncbi:hypothetical protein DMT42_11145 [Streptomyces actuosus]|uniref:Uncharacterized protein n=1 Tax=Streptomyces actuosus TaxID=1885 RepID=A0A2U9P0N1_STRAS|nr:hypothetical protein DMT42_11145 [Streptomyces actuosus]